MVRGRLGRPHRGRQKWRSSNFDTFLPSLHSWPRPSHSRLPLSAPDAPAADRRFQRLDTFADVLANGELRPAAECMSRAILANAVVQQPAGDPGFVSSDRDLLTQFQQASQLGSTGVLAHNFLAGAQFSEIQPGQVIYLVYGDGRTSAFVVRDALRYQALQPMSPYSAFVDLADGRHFGTSELFVNIYGRRGALILQTCIEAEGVSTWGRLFVVAEPFHRRALQQYACTDCRDLPRAQRSRIPINPNSASPGASSAA